LGQLGEYTEDRQQWRLNFSTGITFGDLLGVCTAVWTDTRKQEFRVVGQLLSQFGCSKCSQSFGGFLRWCDLQPREPAPGGRDIRSRHGRSVPIGAGLALVIGAVINYVIPQRESYPSVWRNWR